MADKDKILMVHNFYQIGGGEHTVFKNEVALLRNHGHDVYEYTRSNDELKQSIIKYLVSPFTTIWSFKTYREVRKIIKQEKIDIVHCHNTFPLISPSVYYAARSLKIPVIQTIHNFRFLCPCGTFYHDGHICELCKETGKFSSAIQNKCYRNSKLQTIIVANMLKMHRLIGTYRKINYIFLTEFNKKKFEDIVDINGTNIFLKPNFVEDHFDSDNKSFDLFFVFAGRLDEYKGIKTLLDTWCLLDVKYDLHIYGDGEFRSYVEEMSQKNDCIKFFGFCSQEELHSDLKKATAMLFPSRLFEGFPMTISESFSFGCPVISSNLGNQAELIHSSHGGVTCDFESSEELLKSINEVIDNRGSYSENARAYYEKYLTAENNYRLLSEIYKNAKHIR